MYHHTIIILNKPYGDFQLVVGDRNVARIIGEEETRVGNQLFTMKKYEGALRGFHRQDRKSTRLNSSHP